MVVFESAQAVPLFIVYTDPTIPVVVKVEEKKLNLHTSLLSTTQKSAEKEIGLLFASFDSLHPPNHSFHPPKSINAGDDSIRKENESLKQQLISKGDELARKEQEKQEAIKQKEQEKQENEELKALLLEMRKKLEKKK